MKRIISFTYFFIFIAFMPHAGYSQSIKTASGKIYSEGTRQPIDRATVSSKNSGRALVSGKDGSFLFRDLNERDTLVITAVGYIREEIPVKEIGHEPISIYLRASMGYIDEVVVNTGYHSLPKERATGSFSHVDNELINRSVSTDIINRLEGVSNGLLFDRSYTQDAPSSTANLRVRGLSTILGESEPLIVVDNFPYEGDINNINPNDVESVTILKDAAAASIWGARAGNGVIVITTKGGSVAKRPIINFNSNVNFTEKPDLYYSREYLPPPAMVDLERTLFGRGLYNKNDWTALTPAVELLFAEDEGLIDEETVNAGLHELGQYDIRKEALKHLYRNGVNEQYALSMNGGSESYRYYVSAGYDNNTSNLVGASSDRFTFNVRNDFQPMAKLNVSTSLNYVQGRNVDDGITLRELSPTGMSNIYSYARLADEAGNALPIVKNNRMGYTEAAMAMGLLDWHYRPLDELRLNDNASSSSEIRLGTAISYKLFKGIDVEVRYQYQAIQRSLRNHYNQETYFVRNLINQFTHEDGSQPVPYGGILDKSSGAFGSHYGRFQLNYDTTWGERHQFNGLAGFELRQERDIADGMSRLYGYNDDVLTHSTNLNFDQSYQQRPRSAARIPYGNTSGRQLIDRFVSYYANFGYSFDNRFILSGSARWDASNIFGVSFNQKGVPLWSIGTAWNISNETFLNVDWLSFAKLRLTYGANGNAVRSISALPSIAFGSINPVTGLPMGTLRGVGNPDLSWEQVNVLNLGLDLSLFNNRVSGSLEWFNKSSTNLIGQDLLDPTTGVFWLQPSFNLDNRRNYADMRTNGVDLELNTRNIDRTFKWTTNLLLSYVGNEVTNYLSPPNFRATDYLGLQQLPPPVLEGHPKERLYALPWNGLDETGAPMVMADGQLGTDYTAYFNGLTYDDLRYVGVPIAPYFGSIRNTFSWKSFSVGFNVIWKAGHKFRRESINYNSLFSASRITHIDYLNRWQKPGDELLTNIPSMPESQNQRRDQAYIFSEELIERGDHIRLKDINLSFQLPQKYASSIGLSQVRLYGYINNLGILWKHTKYDIDPDVKSLYPQPMQMAFGLQIQL